MDPRARQQLRAAPPAGVRPGQAGSRRGRFPPRGNGPRADPGGLITITVLRSWSFNPAVVVGLAGSGVLYARGLVRLGDGPPSAPFPRGRAVCFYSGLSVTYLALQSPIHTYSHRLFSVHMVQHLLLMMVAAPLLVLGTPIVLGLRACSPSIRKRFLLPVVRNRVAAFLSNPVVTWSAFTVVLWASHFTNLYEDSLSSEAIHGLEHVLYLLAAVLFWRPVIALEPGPSRISP
ncbi:MAG: cytochrome c oxidase assembly protein, partial [Actinobacteria bacterium]